MTTPNTPTITVDNCIEEVWTLIFSEIRDSRVSTLQDHTTAWGVVYRFCKQNGMDISAHKTGIQNVIHFIDNLLKNQK